MDFKKEQVKLLSQNKPFIVLQNVKDKYPNISSQSVILSQIKRLFLENPNNRLSSYETKIKELNEKYTDNKYITEFENQKPYIQDKIQKKIRNGKIVYDEEFDKIIEKIPLFNKNIDKYIKLPTKDAKTLRRTQTTSLNNKHYNIKIVDGDKLINEILPLLESENSREIIPATLLATGRRQNELINGSIKKSKSGPYFCMFEGQSKTGLDIKRSAYEIPLLAPFNIVEKSWNKSKEYFNNSNREIFKSKIRNIARWLKKKKCNVDKLHEFRSIYALICYDLFPTGRLSQMAYISSVLGETSINIASHYNSIKVENVNNFWIPKCQQYEWKATDKHTKMIIPELNKFTMDECMKQKKKKITKTIIKRVSEKSQKVVDRFYENNKDEIDKYNSLILI